MCTYLSCISVCPITYVSGLVKGVTVMILPLLLPESPSPHLSPGPVILGDIYSTSPFHRDFSKVDLTVVSRPHPSLLFPGRESVPRRLSNSNSVLRRIVTSPVILVTPTSSHVKASTVPNSNPSDRPQLRRSRIKYSHRLDYPMNTTPLAG